MKTILQLGPADHGRSVPFEDYAEADWDEGYCYELIDGRLYVSPLADQPENWLQDWLRGKLKRYAKRQPEVVNHVTGPARVFVPGGRGTTNPEPDVAAYQDFPLHLPVRQVQWQDVSPLLVAEILSAGDPDKDLVRNVALYLKVPSIREYWIIDSREDPDRPTMYVYRRRGRHWQRLIELHYGDTYTTRLLPGFKLRLDPKR